MHPHGPRWLRHSGRNMPAELVHGQMRWNTAGKSVCANVFLSYAVRNEWIWNQNFLYTNRPFPNGHHGLCPHFYNSAFTNKFVAVPKKTTCYQRTLPRDAISYSPNMRMGYWQALDPNYDTTEKTFYAITTRDYPFNSDVLSDSENHVWKWLLDEWALFHTGGTKTKRRLMFNEPGRTMMEYK